VGSKPTGCTVRVLMCVWGVRVIVETKCFHCGGSWQAGRQAGGQAGSTEWDSLRSSCLVPLAASDRGTFSGRVWVDGCEGAKTDCEQNDTWIQRELRLARNKHALTALTGRDQKSRALSLLLPGRCSWTHFQPLECGCR
jgi:hypothetical protein